MYYSIFKLISFINCISYSQECEKTVSISQVMLVVKNSLVSAGDEVLTPG